MSIFCWISLIIRRNAIAFRAIGIGFGNVHYFDTKSAPRISRKPFDLESQNLWGHPYRHCLQPRRRTTGLTGAGFCVQSADANDLCCWSAVKQPITDYLSGLTLILGHPKLLPHQLSLPVWTMQTAFSLACQLSTSKDCSEFKTHWLVLL